MTPRPPLIDRSPRAILDALSKLLVVHPEASLGELARKVGIGRTTLHRLYPTREALLHATARSALEQLQDIDTQMELAAVFTLEWTPEASWAALHAWVEAHVPLGPQLMFLLRARELEAEADLVVEVAALDATLLGALKRAQQRGCLARDLSAPWLVASLNALVFSAWEQIEAGNLAPRDAARVVLSTWRRGVERVDA